MLTRELEETLSYAVDEAVKHKHEYVTLEHLLYALLEDNAARDILYNCGAKIEEIAKALEDYFADVSIHDSIRDFAGGRQRSARG
jgi:ATP-dependent Clp protease ATP-binding subunit ClpA